MNIVKKQILIIALFALLLTLGGFWYQNANLFGINSADFTKKANTLTQKAKLESLEVQNTLKEIEEKIKVSTYSQQLTTPSASPKSVKKTEKQGLNIFSWIGKFLLNFGVKSAYAAESPTISEFTYDSLGRVTSASYSATPKYNYSYDKVGNRLTQTIGSNITTYTYDADNQLTKVNADSFSYDLNGNLTQKVTSTNSLSYLFDIENRLINFNHSASGQTSYRYDGVGNRLEKIGATTTRYVNDVSGALTNVLAETNSSNSIQKWFVYGNGLESLGSSTRSLRMYPLTDGTGNARFLTNRDGEIIQVYNYDPYGNIRESKGFVNNNYQFQDQQLDPESNLYYLRARYYDSTTGRFISRDPVRGTATNPQTQNPYAYAGNNPLIYSDPSGEYAQLIQFGQALIQKCSQLLSKQQVLRGTQNPVVKEAVKKGQEMHKNYKVQEVLDDVRIKEFTGIKGIRPDFVDLEKQIIYELKPNNSQAIKKGLDQLDNYKNQFENVIGGEWKTILDTY